MTGNWYRIEAEKQQIEKERTQAELKNLKSQLNNIDVLEHDGRIVNLGEKYDNGSKKGN